MIEIAVLLALLPFALLADVLRVLAWWRRVPLQQKNHIRAGLGAVLVTLAIGLWAQGYAALFPPIGGYVLAAGGGFGLLWFIVSVRQVAGARFDFMSAFWFAVAALGSAALLVCIMTGKVAWLS